MNSKWHYYCYSRVREIDGIIHGMCNYTWATSYKQARINFAYQLGVYYLNIDLDDIIDITGYC